MEERARTELSLATQAVYELIYIYIYIYIYAPFPFCIYLYFYFQYLNTFNILIYI